MKRGQPRKYASNAVKQKAYRDRKRDEERERMVVRALQKLPTNMNGMDLVRKLRTLTFRKLEQLLEILEQPK